MPRTGLGYDALSRINPKLIMCSISLAGQSGPLSGKPGFDYIAAAYAGITAAIGEHDRAPAQLPMAISDYATGVTAAMAVGFALLHRERTGEGLIDRMLAARHLFQHARGEHSEGLLARRAVSTGADGFAASRRRPDRRVPLPQR